MPPPPAVRVARFEIADEGGDHELAVLSWPAPAAARPESLTSTELAVLEGLLAGQTRAAIARARGRSPATVGHQIEAIYRKLGVSSRAELVAKMAAIARGAP